MKVWIDQDLCTGDGLCEEIAPAVFTLLDDGLAYVKDGDKVLSDPGGLDDRLLLPGGDRGDGFGATRVAEDLVAVLDVGQAVVEEREDVGGDLLAQTVARAEILIDPDLHVGVALPAGGFRWIGDQGDHRCSAPYRREE